MAALAADSIASLDDEAGLRPVLRCIEKSVSRGPERMCSAAAEPG